MSAQKSHNSNFSLRKAFYIGLAGLLISTPIALNRYPQYNPFSYYSEEKKQELNIDSQKKELEESKLEDKIRSIIKTKRDNHELTPTEKTSWLVYDLTHRVTVVDINSSVPKHAGSAIKPLQVLATLYKFETGELNYGPKSKEALKNIFRGSTKKSNNSSNWLMERTGGIEETQRILDEYYEDIFKETQIVEYIPMDKEHEGQAYENEASANDFCRFLIALWNDELPMSGELKKHMQYSKTKRITKGRNIPKNTISYNKTGTTGIIRADIGIIVARGKDEKEYPYIFIGLIEQEDKDAKYNYPKSPNRAAGPKGVTRSQLIMDISNETYLALKEIYDLK
ncbi:MAG: serine hydrolase [Candidatus Nanoarchaeia archaeon]